MSALSFPELDPLRKVLVDELVELARDVTASRRRWGSRPGRTTRSPATPRWWTHRPCPRCTATPACSTTRSTPGRCGVPRRRGQRRGWWSDRRCSGWCGPPTRCRPTGCPPARRCPAAPRSRPAGDRCSIPCSRRSPPRRRWWTCARGRTPRSARVPGAVTVNVLAHGRGRVVSHFNKAHKGRFAGLLAVTRAEPTGRGGGGGVARRAGLRVERRGTRTWTLVLPLYGESPSRDGESAFSTRRVLIFGSPRRADPHRERHARIFACAA